MAKALGSAKTGGRKKGVPNKNKIELQDRIKAKYPDYCPVEAMCEIATDILNEVNIRLTANKEVAQYIYPKLKSIEHKGEGGLPITSSLQVSFVKANVTNEQ